METESRAALHPILAQRWSPRAFDPTVQIDAEQLDTILEAARWAPSASNTQPWRFLAGRRGERAYEALAAALKPTNRLWARDASALVLVAAETAGPDGVPRRWALYDTGQAAAHLSAQAHSMGLAVRQMGGFIPAALPPLPDRVVPLAVAALGVPLEPARIPDDHPATRLAPRARRPLAELLLDCE
ncbi:nitroreductase family protein [Pseudonocardia humida]|uniref:Nitroreductase family protein n=1 Tax=Pseudonocardia humida TaxID=2800819 RepID=A0ABT1A9U1_9PSEU|nr:nitroreductase family protein [Pseudonocardia humida]MCO1659800.1 nitroreductase family protein [Pseudonocardia humida]